MIRVNIITTIKNIILFGEYFKKVERLEERVSALEKENAGIKAFIEIIRNSVEVKFRK